MTGIEFVDPLSGEIVRAVDGVPHTINRHARDDTELDGMFGDIGRKPSCDGAQGRI